MRRRLVILVASAFFLSGLLPTAVGAASAPLPASMVAVGDSISQAASTGGSLGADYPQNAWSTGTNTTVNSHYLRLLAAGAPISGRNDNLSISGAKVGGLNTQMQSAADLRPDYLTVLIGGNDLCTDTVDSMTSTTAFESAFRTAMDTITLGSKETRVYVVSIPDVHQLWELFKSSWWARTVWSAGNICQSLLANPTSNQQVDKDRRAEVRARNQAYNVILANVCSGYTQCHHDGGRVFAYKFAKSDVSGDYFHPSTSGQANLARETWLAGYTWTTGTQNQPPTAAFTYSCADLTCGFTDTSTDGDGTIASRSWSFGDGTSSTATNPNKSYAAGGTYTVTLTATDNGGATSSTQQSVTVSAPTGGISLVVSAYKVKGTKTADLSWSGATSANVDVFRDSVKLTTTANDGAHTDSIGGRGGGTYTYKVCEAGTSTCSPDISVSY